ncbi:MAG TPA: glycogen debranching enzyme N-terminal domain-containing protein, partial [Chitinophagales bacterium]|nr:glycogen debranching enzyme N-terminal domain-containing protein [Chitinophagales bacterium]
MKLTKDAAFLQDYDQAIHCEWLETNGLGGYAGSTVIGCNTRRYHGLLVAAVVPPTERMVLVNKLDESVTIDNKRYDLGCNNYGDAISPKGYQHLVAFKKDLCPEFIYEAGGVQIKKTIAMVHGENTTLIIYEVLKSLQPFTFELTPLLSGRSYHELVSENSLPDKSVVYDEGTLSITLSEKTPQVFIGLKDAGFHPAANWYRHFEYAAEKERGLDHREDLFSPGT